MVITIEDLPAVRSLYRNKKIVLGSGTFDLFHPAHVLYLNRVTAYGDIVVIMINSDTRTRSTKGKGRPIYTEQLRALIVNAINGIDYVFVEPGTNKVGSVDTVHEQVFSTLKPDIYVTSNEQWLACKQIMGSTKLIVIPRSDEEKYHSTTKTIKYIVEHKIV